VTLEELLDMKPLRWSLALVPLALIAVAFAQTPGREPTYVKKDTRAETIVATLKASGLPSLEGPWYWIGPFDNPGGQAFDSVHPPEKEIDLAKKYAGRDGKVAWQQLKTFGPGKVVDLKLFQDTDNTFVYLFHEIDAPTAMELPLSLGSDDSIKVWLNGKEILANNAVRPAMPDQDEATLKLKAGKNQLLVRVGNAAGDFAVYVAPELPPDLDVKFGKKLARDFGGKGGKKDASLLAREAKHYKLLTVPVPKDVVLEVGGLAFRPDGKLLACTRRGEVWLIENPGSDDPDKVKFKLFATGLHEALGILVEGKDVYVVQRPELTKLVDKDGDDVADEYITVCDQWGVSGDYHEFAFGPAKDKKTGDFYVTLNVGFGGGHQSKSPWRGWAVRITPDGKMHPFATGLRSPNGVNFSPDGELFYADNQGEWAASNKIHHLKEGEFYGHQAGLRWVSQSPFAEKIPTKIQSGMRYDGLAGKNGASGMPQVTPPCVWFPYGRMGQSASEPRWDTTGGKFGPFAGQMFVGDQTKSNVMRVSLEKVKGRYQGACFPFRSGGQCGVNRIVFGPDNSMYIGQTNRGWGSLGGKDYGLQRIVYTGVEPFEIHSVKLTASGFDLVFTQPLDPKTAEQLEKYSVQSFTYYYWSTYGCDEIDKVVENVTKVSVGKDGKTVSLTVGNLRPGRVYELRLDGVRNAEGETLLHPEAYYTLNQLR
jgi:glucose/arabinose dehydrogenase